MKALRIKVLSGIAGIMVLASCNHSSLGPAEYVHYINEPGNGLIIQQSYKGVKYSLQYQPADYLVFMEMRNFNVPGDVFKQQYERFKGLEHYNFHIGRKAIDSLMDKTTKEEKKDKVSYLDFGIKKDIKMVEGNDTIKCAICEIVSDGGMYPYYSFTIGFPAKDYDGNRQFLFEGKGVGAGDVKLDVLGKNISKIPDLKYM